jgi:hypothetical protein
MSVTKVTTSCHNPEDSYHSKLQIWHTSESTMTGRAAIEVDGRVQDSAAVPDMPNKNATVLNALAQQGQRQCKILGLRCSVGQSFAPGTLRDFGISGERVRINYISTSSNMTEQRRPQDHRLSGVRIHTFMPTHAVQKLWIAEMLFGKKLIAILFSYVGGKKGWCEKLYEEIYLIVVGWRGGEGWSEYSRILNNI